MGSTSFGTLLLFQNQQVLDVLDVFAFHHQMEMVGLNFLDDIRHVDSDVRHGPPVCHCFGTLIILYHDQFSVRFELKKSLLFLEPFSPQYE